jgi:hypothetical protein
MMSEKFTALTSSLKLIVCNSQVIRFVDAQHTRENRSLRSMNPYHVLGRVAPRTSN